MSFIQPKVYLKIIFFCSFLTFTLGLDWGVHAQVRPNLGNTSRLLNNALAEMDKGNYEQANTFFRQIVESNQPIPPEMPYYFAETLFQLEQYDNSRNFLTRYLQINGFRGENYQKAKELEERLKQPLQAIQNCDLCDRRGYRFASCPTCEGAKQVSQPCNYCKAKGAVGCNRCFGKGLLTRRNIFNIVEYHECGQCQGQGKHTCPQCEGSLEEFSDCRTCSGLGRLVEESICNHQAGPKHMSMVFQKLQKQHGNPTPKP
ncbi:outer membrane protein assembly factor BamD [Mongoliitalea daihaiensis]|uniref:tetratricopeptide repeat protein n=1 Tax=Mongoliitalea daihaiensis TaxID=2782006 RepID=UPI001F340B7B|nr:tetratricopeptide repeat protein [Mongoliitalea daihaiensis]UJP63900.1 molecular chaperone DnaJ [Mongoliitalea daihaiensis]